MALHRHNVAAIIVTYKPEERALLKLVDRLSQQVSRIYIVDNASSMELGLFRDDVSLTELPSNMGIAYAQNFGLRKATAEGFTDFVLFDQDSLPSETMVFDLLQTRRQAASVGIRVAAVGPVHIDQDSFSENIFIDTLNGRVDKLQPQALREAGRSFARCDFLIASGCLLSIKALEAIGYMEDELFIDCVDIEWGFRAKSIGWHCIASFNAQMFHKIGEAPLKLLGRSITTHTPLRHYYFYRNFYQLVKRAYIPSCWKWHTLAKSCIQAVIFSLFLAPRFEQLKYILKGIFHGLVSKSGKYE